jgi:hypothetical protein
MNHGGDTRKRGRPLSADTIPKKRRGVTTENENVIDDFSDTENEDPIQTMDNEDDEISHSSDNNSDDSERNTTLL